MQEEYARERPDLPFFRPSKVDQVGPKHPLGYAACDLYFPAAVALVGSFTNRGTFTMKFTNSSNRCVVLQNRYSVPELHSLIRPKVGCACYQFTLPDASEIWNREDPLLQKEKGEGQKEPPHHSACQVRPKLAKEDAWVHASMCELFRREDSFRAA